MQQEIAEAIKSSKSFREAAKKLGWKNGHQRLKRLVLEAGIDFSHFQHGKRYESMVDQEYGLLTVRAVTPLKDKHRRYIASCECKCGGKKEIRCDMLQSGVYISCGCAGHDRLKIAGCKNPSFKGIGELGACHYNSFKRSAARRDIAFDVTKEELWEAFEKQDKRCHYTGELIVFGRYRRHHETTCSLDRTDSDRDYTKDNIKWTLKEINLMKGTLSEQRFIELCRLVAKHHPEFSHATSCGSAVPTGPTWKPSRQAVSSATSGMIGTPLRKRASRCRSST